MKLRGITKAVSRLMVFVLCLQALMSNVPMMVKASPTGGGTVTQYTPGFHVKEDTGMTILQLAQKPDYYQNNYENTLDKNKIPGTTVLAYNDVDVVKAERPRVASAWKGAKLDESNFIAAVQQTEEVTAQKSYFTMEDQLACLGAGINNVSSDTGREVHTIIEDYKFDDITKDKAVLRISKKPVKAWGKFFPNNEIFTFNDVDKNGGNLKSNKFWAFILPAGLQKGNGYYFKENEKEFNFRFVESGDTIVKKNYLQLWLNHGTKNDASYEYSMFKEVDDNSNQKLVRGYMDDNKAITISNTKEIQASFYKRTDTVAANIWAENGGSVEHGDISNFKVNAKSSIMMRKKAGLLEIAVSDPTGTKDGTIELEIDSKGYDVISKDSNITEDFSVQGKIKLIIDVTGKNGETSKITISTIPKAVDENATSIDIVRGNSELLPVPAGFEVPLEWTTYFKRADGTPIKNVGSDKKKDELKQGEEDNGRSEGIASTSHIAIIEGIDGGGLITAREKGVVYAKVTDKNGQNKEWKVNILFEDKSKLPAVTKEDYERLRGKWVSLLVGRNLDKDDTSVMETVNNLNTQAEEIWNRYVYKGQNVCNDIPWTEKPPKENPNIEYKRDAVEFRPAFQNVLLMAKAYRTEHGALYNNPELLKDMINILEWLTTNCYCPQSQTDNWWTWEIGMPKDIIPTLILLSDKLTKEQKEKFTEGVRFFQPDPYHGGAIGTGSTHVLGYRMQYAANRVDNSVTAMGLGLLLEDNEFMYLASLASSSVLEFATVKDSTLLAAEGFENGFYKDGSYIDHSRTPYAGSYGVVVLEGIVNISSILGGSPWQFNADKTEILETIFVNTYGISMYKGLVLEMLRGRAVARENVTGKTVGRQIMTYVIKTLDSVGAEKKAILLNCLKSWLSADVEYISTLKELNELFVKQKAQEILNNSGISADLPSMHKNFPLMDRAIHRTKDWLFGLSMYSERILNTEIMNGENLYGWHQGDGMTYLYGKDNTHYTDNYWNTVNPFRLAGTTTVSKNIGNGVKDSSGFYQDGDYTSKEDWVGGSELSDCGVNGMSLSGYNDSKTPYEPNLKALKSYFMFGDEIVCLGSGISDSGSNFITETTVENRKLNDAASNKITKDGNELTLNPISVKVAEIVEKEGLGNGEGSMVGTDLNDTKWVHMEGTVPEDSIGWYFPKGTNKLKARKVASRGNWGNINLKVSTDVVKNYFELWFDHGNNPQNEEYSYVILPRKSAAETETYAKNPTVEILANTTDVQAAGYKNKSIIGANFWQDKEASAAGITCNKKASVIMKQTGNTLEIGVSDPTMKNTGSIEVEIDKTYVSVVRVDSNVTVSNANQKIHLSVNTKGKKGDTSVAILKLRELSTEENESGSKTPQAPSSPFVPDAKKHEKSTSENKQSSDKKAKEKENVEKTVTEKIDEKKEQSITSEIFVQAESVISKKKEDKKTVGLTVEVGKETVDSAIKQATKGETKKVVVNLGLSIPTKSTLKELKKLEEIKKVKLNFIVPQDLEKKGTVKITDIRMEKEVLKEIIKKGADFNISVQNEEKKNLYSWSMNGKDLKEAKADTINFALDIVSLKDSEPIKSLVKEKKGEIISFAHVGKLPGTATIKIYDTDKFDYTKNQKLYVYYYNDKKERVEETYYSKGKFLGKGGIEFKISHCSDYVLLPKKLGKKSVVSLMEQMSVVSKLKLKVGEKKNVFINIAEGAKFSCKSGNTKVVTVKNGVVKGKAEGETVVKVTVKIKGKTSVYKTKVRVKK
ncbi:MAG: polysaccharide lyase family 8 super-sandwich domain-containing protein [Catonella sp.]|uniref:polysaccharide lyase family 8 super-sandwich domain-containing protein n=1 Tax=Catonella sp. TaxID=2382125 RepID=UPI003F9FFCCE